MLSAIILCLFFTSSFAIRVDVDKEPVYKYRHQVEETMKSSASEYPYHNYYPQYPTGYYGGVQGGGYGGKLIGGGGYGAGYGGAIGGYGGQIGGYGGVGGVGGYAGGVGGVGGLAGGVGGYAGGVGGLAGGVGGLAGGVGGYAGGVGGLAGGVGVPYVAPYIGGVGVGGGGYFPGQFGGNYGPAFYPHYQGHGGGYVDKKNFVDENKKAGGQSFEKAEGSKGESGQHGKEGFTQGQVAVKNIQGDSGYYNNQAGDKKGYNDGRAYQGGEQYSQNGGKGEGENQKANHRKGHSRKGFKSTHHKDETGSEETFYDDAHDEGGNFRYGSNEGTFGTKGQNVYKGGHENGQFIADEKRKQGQYEKQQIVDNANADKGQYGQKGYHGSSQGYSANNGAGQQSLLGRQEANRLYYNQHPHGYVPIFDQSK